MEKPPKEVTEEDLERLEANVQISDFKKNKLEIDAKKNWDIFYKRNTTNFFKDRQWTTREFEELCDVEDENKEITLLEVGCGVGNFVLPLLEKNKNAFIYACDFSPRAVKFLQDNPIYEASDRCKTFECDVTKDSLSETVQPNSVDIASLIFVLSAIHPEKMLYSIENIYKVLKPGGILIFRDYGLYDHAMLRFAPNKKLDENLYVRQDGTRSYFFTTGILKILIR
ncbi:DgyrCDS12627 [Dimorphilus gyrociliatus]|uniref:DgyrCDS12627 n=1 Tax=Dimorphilus gyrociliatus TaxID=2664684 RepID=A0A7I8W721_9ANNE|nr:DgyrCDS12627 [Dimorphilus gyrociliatus]